MSNSSQQIDHFLSKAESLLTQNNVVDALPLAQQASRLATTEDYIRGIIAANILLSKLALHNAKYLGHPSNIALDYMEKIDSLAADASPESRIAILLQIQSDKINLKRHSNMWKKHYPL